MARPKARIPAYYLHKSSGRAYLTPDGKPVYRGEHGTPESHDKFTQVIAEWSEACETRRSSGRLRRRLALLFRPRKSPPV